ncbi:PCI domain-containing protein [Metarhizium acridum CQMa 102]|uniref:PCI domain-containing protein n=1 Tax=Metarhizium acridum (strain CQMa 102) TaxID=655827 RepID=E9DST3_METAQ|nr:PCI domain-containing protein [Metarhizium acridum CQMa 102]EFY93443.1 PCI domain-containing protein [Metarhizium acridum CQMa 102]
MSLVAQFLTQINQYVRLQQGDSLRAWLQVEPNSAKSYYDMAAELRANFNTASGLEAAIDTHLPIDDDVPDGQATAWPSFQSFMKDYLTLWRDINYDDLLGTHELLTTLVNSCGTAFAHPTYGAMLLQASMSFSVTLARFTLQLNRRPDLTRRIRSVDEDSGGKSVAESSAEIIQKIFTTCLTDRSVGRVPEGKKVGVYMFANLVLKLLFARVTFLYYLGRFNFSNQHYQRAALCLEQAYLQTPPPLVSHRTNILTYLIPCNILLGRFPSGALMQRPEAATLKSVFVPLCEAVRVGNFIQFQHHLSTHETWLFEKGLLLALTHRLRPLLWRSLARKTFVFTYVPPADASSRKAATLDISHLHAAAVYVQRRLEGWLHYHPSARGRPSSQANPLFMRAVTNNVQESAETTLVPPPRGPTKLRPNEGLIWGNAEITLDDVEMVVATLVQQGLMHGFVAHGQARFAIIGAKAKGPVVAGWPVVWQAIQERRYEGDFDINEVPGWVKG